MKKRIVAMLLASVMCLTLLAGCGGNSKGGENNTQTVMTVDGENVPASELAAYIVYNINYYQQYYSQMGLEMDSSYFQDEEIFDSLKESAADQVKALRALEKIAADMGVKLTSEQKKELKEVEKSNMEYTGAQSDSFKRWVAYTLKGKEDPWADYLHSMGYTEELFQKDSEILKLEEGIIDYYYEQGDVTDRFHDTYYHAKSILISDSDDDGNLLTGSAKKEAKQKAEDLLQQIKDGADFDELWANNNDDTAQSEDGYYFTEGDMVDTYEEAVAEMDEDSISDELVYYESYGWFIIQRLPMDDDALEDPNAYMYNYGSTDEDATTLKEILGNSIVEEKIDEYMENMEVEYTDEYDKITMNNVHTYLGFVMDPLVSTEGSGSVADGSAGGSAE